MAISMIEIYAVLLGLLSRFCCRCCWKFIVVVGVIFVFLLSNSFIVDVVQQCDPGLMPGSHWWTIIIVQQLLSLFFLLGGGYCLCWEEAIVFVGDNIVPKSVACCLLSCFKKFKTKNMLSTLAANISKDFGISEWKLCNSKHIMTPTGVGIDRDRPRPSPR